LPDPHLALLTRHEDLENVDVAVACMLLGSIAFVMGLFYLVNHSDQDIRRYSWEVISTTIAIFTSVLIFQGLDGIFVAFVAHLLVPAGWGDRQRVIVLVSIVHFLCWFTAMHTVVAKLAFGKNSKEGEESQEAAEAREQEIKCWATLLSHMTAFAAIATWCDVQKLPAFAKHPITSAVPVVMHVAALFVLFRFTDFVRNVLFGTGGGLREKINMWDEEGEEGENDLAAISISFLVVQVIRYAISGVLGDETGVDLTPRVDTFSCIFTLLAASLLFLTMLFSFVRLLTRTMSRKRTIEFANDDVPTFHSWEGFDSMRKFLRRWGFILMDTSGMSFAWCLLYATKWAVHLASVQFQLPLAKTETINGICLALCTSVMACLMIFGINWICDRRCSHDIMWKQFRSIIRSLGILIGFAWEQPFDAGVEAVAKLAEPKGLWHALFTKLALACVVGLVVVPAWRHHILKTVLCLRDKRS